MSASAGLRIALVTTAADLRACHPVMVQLRPDHDEDAFVAQVQRQRLQGYQLAAGRDEGGAVVVVAGFVLCEKLAWGRHLYVDDLVTDGARRSTGAGAAMLAWLGEFARDADCASIHLDSGVQRHDAHRFYDRQGMARTSLHFEMPLDAPSSDRFRSMGAVPDDPFADPLARLPPRVVRTLGAMPPPAADVSAAVDHDDEPHWDPSHEGGLDPDFDDL
ncbi:MAG TPA: GNAT family N-acetyltransferase [Pseudomonadales bacterium]|nr:GNAT family N-acetyltransferase [Pseudomonadales bacterium]